MISKSRWKLLAMLAVVLAVMLWYCISWEDSFYFPIPEKKEPCLQGEAERKASKLFGNYSRDQPIFLQLKDYFWVKTPSAYELPYGTKGSEDLLLRVLAITSYSIPESIQSLRCRRCVVVGNGHRLRNSSLGDAINKYDVVIRLNNAPVAGYEGDVGSKTTMRLFYPESAHFDPKAQNNPDTLLVLVAFKAMDFHWIETILSDKKRVRKGFWKQPPLIWNVNPEQIRILNPFFMEIAADKLLNLPMQQLRKIKQMPTTRSRPFTTMSRSRSSPWRGQAITSPKRRWPLSGCWRWEPSRTSRPSDLGESCSLSVAYSAVWVTPICGCGDAWCQYDPLGLTPSWGGSPGPGQV
ncbi:CMP-N-acetylneuraminate-beta-galactosamide-alpha-2,3-sialyltransferase 4 isoform X8 [Sapajus apella]|uniref:CMP-N-acetylneuraminate-beta-galactosamide-alpha-2,3-sialyltransferase 4 n=1 Tax=Sapajus apella TaxID=9515 RepID=A0A6J3IEY9_SAPAP|nr:CMP-N-acetylneuraminate-beta-galactosamide-alpha-2,3-sialyltransferase 4 isoform X8 [Sapajus apella]